MRETDTTGRTITNRVGAAFLLACVLVLPSIAAVADTNQPVGVEIAPSRIERDQLSSRAISQSFFVTNHETSPRRISMSVAGLGHDLDGTPEFLEPAAATNALHLDATSFVLAPGERKEIHGTGAIPDTAHALYAAVIAEFAPLQAASGTVESHSRVASLLLLRGPKPWTETLSVEDVGLLPGATKGTFNVFASLKDTGDVHVRPTGTAKISKDGTLLATVALTGQTILPGFARRISGVWTPPPKASGTVHIEVTTRPTASGAGDAALTAGAAGRPQAKIVNLRGHDESGALVTLTLVNVGSTPITPAVTLFANEGATERARTILTPGAIAPGKSVDLEWRPGLDDGVYVVTAQARSADLLLDQSSTGLRLGGSVGAQGSARTPPKKSALTAIAALLLGLCLVALFMISNRKRNRPGGGVERPRHAAAA